MACRNWCFTLNATEQQADAWSRLLPGDLPLDIYRPDDMFYLVYQVERGTHVHLQGYVNFKTKVRLNRAKGFISPSAHLEKARGTPSENKAYCTKDDTRLAGPFEFGELQQGQGHRTDLDEVCDQVRAGVPLSTIATQHSATYVRNYRGLRSLSQITSPSPYWRDLRVTVLWGPTGSGKTRTARESVPRDQPQPYFVVMPAIWWDSYDRHDTVIFDDFYGQIPYAYMLRLLDGYPLELPIKGGHVWAHYTKVFITSNQPPEEWYIGVPDKSALCRRCTEVIHMGA